MLVDLAVEKPDLQQLKQVLTQAGVEIYRTQGSQIRVAERVRFHMMDAGVHVEIEPVLRVAFVARSQRSDFPQTNSTTLFDKVRTALGALAQARGFREDSSATVEIKDPMNEQHVLDVWHEITYAKDIDDGSQVVEDVRWALGLKRYIDE